MATIFISHCQDGNGDIAIKNGKHPSQAKVAGGGGGLKSYKFGQGGNIAIATPAKYDYLNGQGAVDVYEVKMPGNFQRVKAADFLAGLTPAVIAQLDNYEVM